MWGSQGYDSKGAGFCVGQPRTGRRKQSQQNVFQDSKNIEDYVLGLESTESILTSCMFLNVKLASSS